MLHWLERNVLSVGDFMWAREVMRLLLPDGREEDDPLRGEVKLNRLKDHLFEGVHEYTEHSLRGVVASA
jgi:hypothetical protein